MTLKILVIDDSTTIQKIFKISLSRHIADIYTASSFAEALSELRLKQPNLLVVDANLPGVKGPSDLLRMQKDSGNAPVLLLAGSHENFDEEAFGNAGYTHLLRKPFESTDILRALTLLLGEEIPMRGSASEMSGPSAVMMSPSGFLNSSDENFSDESPRVSLPPLPVTERTRVSIPTPEDDHEEMMRPPPPPPRTNIKPPEVDGLQLGKKAFEKPGFGAHQIAADEAFEKSGETVLAKFSIPETHAWEASRPTHSIQESTQSRSSEVTQDLGELKRKLEDFLRNEAPIAVRKAVEKYCEEHFSSLAREILTAELRRLAEEKSRMLST